MTLKDYATIQRNLGYIEGVLSQFDSDVNAGSFDAISVIDGIIDKEIDDVERFPSADVAPVRHGRLEWFDEDVGTPISGYEREWGWRCSCCGIILPDEYDDPDRPPRIKYCYGCGARLDGAE